ncbi:MAG: hypothetical protein QOE41_2258 [Mycobacterium sp.]|nr:hypothetical protein [Mycobacterium sp.]
MVPEGRSEATGESVESDTERIAAAQAYIHALVTHDGGSCRSRPTARASNRA